MQEIELDDDSIFITTTSSAAVDGVGSDTLDVDIDSSQVDYFRLYDGNDNVEAGAGDGDVNAMASNFIIGIWNPITSNNNDQANSITLMTNATEAITSTWTTVTSLIGSVPLVEDPPAPPGAANTNSTSTSFLPALTSLSTSAAQSALTATYAVNNSMTATAAATFTVSTTAPPFGEFIESEESEDSALKTAAHDAIDAVASNNYGDDVEIALIDSAETALSAGNDYGVASFGSEPNGMEEDLIQQAIGLSKNESFHQIYDGGGGMGGDGVMSYLGGDGPNMAGAPVIKDGDAIQTNGGSSFMLLLEDFGEYFYNYNGSGGAVLGTTTIANSNTTGFDYRINCTTFNSSASAGTLCYDLTEVDHNYWALILILFPILTLFGNILVILSVCRERSLQTVTNYFIVSLAIADLLVAVVVMPFAVYVLVNGIWSLPNFVCDFYIAMDVICSTSSIFNLVAISIDRYIAVTQPIKYAKHKNSRRVCLTILLVWAISAAIGSPIVLGLNNTPNRDPDLCVFYNTDFILYSSLSSFYIPCIIMVFLYWNIFKALRSRARKQRAARKPHLSELTGGSVIENIAQTRRLAETTLDNSRHTSRIMPDEPATNTGSGSNEEEEENAASPDIDDCHVIVNDKSTEFMLATVVEETGNVVAQITTTTQPQLVVADPNGNHDSGYAPSNVDDVLAGAADSSPPDSPIASGTTLKRSSVSSSRSRKNTNEGASPKREPALSVAMKPLSFVRYGVQEAMTLARNDSTLSTTSKTSSRKDKKNSQASRFTIYKVHKASKKKREKSSAKKERKATKTLAIVLGVFLFCWVPFFSCNIMDAMCAKFEKDCRPGVTAFILTTWLGYINSFVNPVIYTIFNPEFRKAFKKIMHMG